MDSKLPPALEKLVAPLMDVRTPMQKVQELIMEARLRQIGKARLKYQQTHQQVGEIRTGHIKTDPETKERYEVVVPVHRFTGWDYGKKYTGAKLRQIRNDQTIKAIKDQTHFADGTPIQVDRLIDLVA